MRILILGTGAREHALAWKFSKSRAVKTLFTAPGNAGTQELGENIDEIDILDPKSVLSVCQEKAIDLVFVGPEAPMEAGIVDILQANKIDVIGADKSSARLETSKIFSKSFMNTHKIPAARAREFSDTEEFESYILSSESKLVVKKNGLAAGKGVLESSDKNELLNFGKKILENDGLLVEEFLEGWETSIFAVTDGNTYKLLPPCADFKKAEENDRGLNTGGMGSICPVPAVDKKLLQQIEKEIISPTFEGMKKEGLSYKGIVFFGIMITEDGPKAIEYNVRFGDPETQVLLPLIKSDFGELARAIINGNLDGFDLDIDDNFALGVVIASGGYPGKYKKGFPVKRIPVFPEKDTLIFHASTGLDANNQVITGGGRCFTVVGIGSSMPIAQKRAYEVVPKISFETSWYRNDIGKKFIKT